MTRSDLIEKLAIEKDIPLITAEKVVTELFKCMADTLVAGGRVEVRGFGSFEVRTYDGHIGRNPSTGKEVTVKPKLKPHFKCGKELKERIMLVVS